MVLNLIVKIIFQIMNYGFFCWKGNSFRASVCMLTEHVQVMVETRWTYSFSMLTSFLPRSRALRTQLCVLVTSLSDPHETSTGPPLESPLWPETHCWPSSLHRRRALPRGRFTLEDNSLTSGSAASRGSRNLGTCNMGSRWGSLSAWFWKKEKAKPHRKTTLLKRIKFTKTNNVRRYAFL